MRIVVLVSGSGTNLQALLDAAAAERLPFELVAVGSDIAGCRGLERANAAAVPTFAVPLSRGGDREAWNQELAQAVRERQPDLVVLSGFMRILGERFLNEVGVPVINTHPALLPSFPGAHAVRDALNHGVRITGCTVHQVDAGVDTGPILAQTAVEIRPDDDEPTLHERIKVQERALLHRTLLQLASGELHVGDERS